MYFFFVDASDGGNDNRLIIDYNGSLYGVEFLINLLLLGDGNIGDDDVLEVLVDEVDIYNDNSVLEVWLDVDDVLEVLSYVDTSLEVLLDYI